MPLDVAERVEARPPRMADVDTGPSAPLVEGIGRRASETIRG